MKGKTAGFLIVACMGIAAAGCYAGAGSAQPEQVVEEKSTDTVQFAESSELKAPSVDAVGTDVPDEGKEDTENPGTLENLENTKEEQEQSEDLEGIRESEEMEETRESIPEKPEQKRQETPETEVLEEPRKEVSKKTETVREKTGAKKTENASTDIHIRKTYSSSDVPPADTIGFVPSRREEIMEDRYIESVVDENDPSSYEIVKKEEKVPTLYVNNAGDIKYAYEDGIWYEYRYSSVNITLDTKDEDLALLILNMDGSYDEYEVVSTDCTEVKKEDGRTEYEFHVRYQGSFVMEDAPFEVAHLTPVELGRVAATRTVVIEEKVPVMMKKSVGTGEYRYYGWQVLDGKTYYFDQNGNKVTGSQVIQGIRHEFDENGVRISHAGVEVTEENGKIDWKRVSDAGVDYAVIQCAYRDAGTGGIVMDSCAEENITGAQAAGLGVILSMFSQAVTVQEAIEEAKAVISMAEGRDLKAPIAVTGAYANPEHNGRADRLDPSERTACMNAFCQTVKENGYESILHAEKDWMTDCLIMEELMDNPLWVAEYNTNLTYTGTCRFWQYTARGTVDGISGYTGLMISYENRRDFQ